MIMPVADQIARSLREGKLIAYPTETTWGLGCDATQSELVKKIANIKSRTPLKSMSVLVSHLRMVEKFCQIDDFTKRLITAFWPGPVTFVLPIKDNSLPQVRGESEFIGLRMSSHPLVRQFMNSVDFPVVTTSANQQGNEPALRLEELNWLPNEVLKFGTNDGVEGKKGSTVVKVQNGKMEILREGDFPIDVILNFVKS